MEYTRVSKGLNDYKLYPKTNDFTKIIESAGDTDFYYGVYTYEEKHYEQWKKTKSLAGIRDVTTDLLLWDFDYQDELEVARKDAREAYSRLLKKGFSTDDIQIYFSGNRGFHLIIKLEDRLKRKEFENIVFGLCGDLKTLDTTVKDQQRLIRMPFTKNQKTGLYCVPLTLDEFNDKPISAIQAKAKELSIEDWELYSRWKNKKAALPGAIIELKEMTLKEQKEEKNNLKFDDRLDVARKPKWLSPTKFALQEGFFKEGERNTAFMILAATYRAHGLPKEIVWRMLKGVAELQAKRTGGEEYSADQLWKEVVCTVYSEHWKGGTYSESETELLRLTAERFNLEPEDLRSKNRLVTYKDMKAKVLELAENFSNQRIFTGFDQIDKSIVIVKGMAFGILGAPGAGKTSVINKMVKHNASQGRRVLFESLDMSDVMMGIKPALSKLEGNYDFGTLMKSLENKINVDEIMKAFDDAEVEHNNITYNYRTSTVEDIEDDIREYYRINGVYPDMVVIDYFEKIRGPKGDPQGDAHYIIPRLTDLAKEYNVCIPILLQPQKAAGDLNEPLLSMRNVKGASIIEQDLRLIFTLWRPGANRGVPEDDKFVQMAIVKNNMGPLERYKFHWTGRTGDIRNLTNEEEYQLQRLLDRIEKEKADSEEGFGGKRKTL